MMDAVARSVEHNDPYREIITKGHQPSSPNIANAITAAAREVAETTDVKAICSFTHSGTTAMLAARERPSVPILALTPFKGTARRLSLVWGLHCAITEEVERFKLAVVSAARVAVADGFATEDEHIVVTAGVPFNTPGTTNILRVAPCDEAKIYAGEPH